MFFLLPHETKLSAQMKEEADTTTGCHQRKKQQISGMSLLQELLQGFLTNSFQ
jgi:hypothetical protein